VLGYLSDWHVPAQPSHVTAESLGGSLPGSNQVICFGMDTTSLAAKVTNLESQKTATVEGVQVPYRSFLGGVYEQAGLPALGADWIPSGWFHEQRHLMLVFVVDANNLVFPNVQESGKFLVYGHPLTSVLVLVFVAQTMHEEAGALQTFSIHQLSKTSISS